MVYKVPYEECKEFRPDGTKNPDGSKRRSILKAIVLGIMYSKEPNSIAEDLGISVDEATNVYNTFFETFPKVKRFIDDTQNNAKLYGYVETLWGRKRRLPNMQLPRYEFSTNEDYISKDFNPLVFEEQEIEISQDVINSYTKKLDACRYNKQRYEVINKAKESGIIIKLNDLIISEASRQCVNSRVQGTASEMTKLAMINVHNFQKLEELGYNILLTIHDEIMGECPVENAKEVSEIVRDIMVKTAENALCVPMKCDVEITKKWTGEVLNVL